MGEFREKSVFWYLTTAAGGLLAGIVFNFLVCGELLNLGYPWNTFLFNPAVRGSDLSNHLAAAFTLAPYHAPLAAETVYPPFAYLMLYPLSLVAAHFGVETAYALFAVGGAALCGWFAADALARFRNRSWIVAALLLATSYPLWMALDRGNLDLLLVPLVGAGLLASERRPMAAAVLLAVPIAAKLSPAVFLLVPLMRRNWKTVLSCCLLVVGFELAALAAFRTSTAESLVGWGEQLAHFKTVYVEGNSGFLYNASVFPLFKAVCRLFNRPELVRFYEPFAVVMGLATLLAGWRLLPRRLFSDSLTAAAIFVLCPHFSMDYRLLYLLIPVVFLFRSPPENQDFAAHLALLCALVAVPKQYWFFGGSWVGIGSFANPVLLSAAVLYMTAGRAGAAATSGKSPPD